MFVFSVKKLETLGDGIEFFHLGLFLVGEVRQVADEMHELPRLLLVVRAAARPKRVWR